MDPLGNIPLFMSLLKNIESRRRAAIVVRECLIAYAVLVLFVFFGEPMLKLLGLSDSSLNIAGGVPKKGPMRMIALIYDPMVREVYARLRLPEQGHRVQNLPLCRLVRARCGFRSFYEDVSATHRIASGG